MTNRALPNRWYNFRVIAIVYIAGLLMVGRAEGSGQYCRWNGRLLAPLFPAGNRALKNFSYRNQNVPNHVMCGRYCAVDIDCKSINFYQSSKLCELSNLTRVDRPEDFIEYQGGVYFDTYEETSLYSVADGFDDASVSVADGFDDASVSSTARPAISSQPSMSGGGGLSRYG